MAKLWLFTGIFLSKSNIQASQKTGYRVKRADPRIIDLSLLPWSLQTIVTLHSSDERLREKTGDILEATNEDTWSQ